MGKLGKQRYGRAPFTPPEWSHQMAEEVAYSPFWIDRSLDDRSRFFASCERYDSYDDLPPALQRTYQRAKRYPALERLSRPRSMEIFSMLGMIDLPVGEVVLTRSGALGYGGLHPDKARSLVASMRKQPRCRGMSVAQFFDYLPFALDSYIAAYPSPDWRDQWRAKYQPDHG